MYNITGWSGGGRRPLSYNLMPGQFRNTRVNVFSNQTIINNNIGGFGGCYDYDCGCGCDGGSSKMSWMDWTMMGGMLLNGLGSILACFWGGGGGGSSKAAEKATDQTDLKNLKTLYSTYNIVQNSDGSFTAKAKDGKSPAVTADSAKELMALLDGEPDKGASPANANSTAKNKVATEGADPTDSAKAPKGLGSDWNGVEFAAEKFDIKKIIDFAEKVNNEIDTSTMTTTFGTTLEGTGIPSTITVKNADGGEYVFELVENYNDYLTSGNGNIRYACVKTPDGKLAADQQQQFDLTPTGEFTQAGMEDWQGFKHTLDFKIASGNHKGEGYREKTFSGFNNISAFPSANYTHVRVPRNSKQANNFVDGMTLDAVLKACGITNPTKAMREAFLKMNQDAFDMSGRLVNSKDLDVFIPNTQKTTWGIK